MASGSGKGHFNPRSPHGERRHLYGDLSRLWHFNPRSPHGERRDGSSLSIIDFVFQPTLPARGATKMTTGLRASTFEFQPTLPARGATRLAACRVSGSTISTHAPRTGSDTTNCIVEISTTHFNPRSPHGERRGLLLVRWDIPSFQPTLPARGATIYLQRRSNRLRYFNPRSPHGERRAASV